MHSVYEPLLDGDCKYLLFCGSGFHSLSDFNVFMVIRSSNV